MSKGDFSRKITTEYSGDFAVIKQQQNLIAYILEIASVLNKMANGDLNTDIKTEFLGEFMQIKTSINTIVDEFNAVFREFNNSVSQVSTGAKQMSNTSTDLAEGACIQTSSVNKLSDIITQIEEQSKRSAERSNNVYDISDLAKKNARTGVHGKGFAVAVKNSASAEEGAAASEKLSSQAEILQSRISDFQLKK